MEPGGKGINVSVVLSRLGEETDAIAYAAGFTGRELQRLVEEQQVRCSFIELAEGFTRINVKLKSGEVTEFNGSGIRLSEERIRALEERLHVLDAEDTLILSGSIPSGADEKLYARLAEASGAGTLVVDAVGEVLLSTLKYRPLLVKPNADELAELRRLILGSSESAVDISLHDSTEIADAAKLLQLLGARNVLISLGGDGAVLVSERGEVWQAGAPKGEMVDTVGAGDTMLAAFLHAYKRFKDCGSMLAYAVAAGSATAYSKGLAERALIEELFRETSAVRLA